MLKIGEIVGSHGVRGEVKVYSHTDFPERFFDLETVKARKGKLTRSFHVEKVRRHKNFFIILFAEVASRNQAEELQGWELVVEVKNAVPLPPGHYYDFQLLGLEVWNILTNSVLGTIVEVLHLPANAVYRVENSQGKSLLIPALRQVVKRVDLENRRMDIEPLEGLWE